MRADWLSCEEISHVLASLTPPNRLALEVAMATGARIGDVLHITTDQLRRMKRYWSYREQKTGKPRRAYIPQSLRDRMAGQAGAHYVWEGRLDGRKPRTTSAVYKDLVRAARRFNIRLTLTPHSTRKAYAVEEYKRTGDLSAVRDDLNHSRDSVTMLYALADELTARKYGGRRKTAAGKRRR